MKFLILTTFILSINAFQPVTVPRARITSCTPALNPRSTSKLTPPFNNPRCTLRMSSAAADDEGEGVSSAAVVNGETPSGGTASIPNEIFNLVKSIVGAGVLSLPAGIAAFGNAPSATIPAVILITIIGLFSGYGFSLIGRVCSYTGGKSYRDAWSESVGSDSSWIPAVTCTLKTCFAVLSYSMILADTMKALFMTATGIDITRTVALLGITTTTLLPLCLLKNLSSLAPFSLVGVTGMLYTSIAMALRYFQTAAVPAGKFLADVATNYQPKFGNLGASGAMSPNVFILICMLSTAYMAHFNAPKFYIELKNNTIKRYNTVVGTSFGISVALFASVASLGFLTFGSASSGLILNNYASRDLLMNLSRVAVAISIVFSFPLAFVGARDGWLDLLKVPLDERSDSLLNNATLAILSVITLIATQLKELAFIMSFAGATLGNALIYVYPALMFKSAVRNMGEKASKGLKKEVPFAMFSAFLGVVMGGIGAKMALGML
ncbi:hypothetical protein ACHAXN_006489 [Cyclotella atomus]